MNGKSETALGGNYRTIAKASLSTVVEDAKGGERDLAGMSMSEVSSM